MNIPQFRIIFYWAPLTRFLNEVKRLREELHDWWYHRWYRITHPKKKKCSCESWAQFDDDMFSMEKYNKFMEDHGQ